jgi:methylamine--corrinoid protein Co-methyltransferase
LAVAQKAKALTQRVTVFEAFNRAKTGQKVDESVWDYDLIPKTASRLKEKYGIKMDKKVLIPTDETLVQNLFKAGMEMLVECGIYCMDTGRVIKYTENEVWTSVAAAPKRAIIGEGRDARVLEPRSYKDSRPPIIQGGPTGAPCSEEQFLNIHQSYAKEGIVDTIVDGVLQTIHGYDPTPNSPWEIAAVKNEAYLVRLAQARAGRPGMGL